MSDAPVGPVPSESRSSLRARIVFAADIIVIAQAVELIEEVRVVEFLAVGLMARGDGGDLDMTDDPLQVAERNRHVAVQDLPMVDVELQLDVGQTKITDEIACVSEIVEKIGRHASRVDRLQKQVDAGAAYEIARR